MSNRKQVLQVNRTKSVSFTPSALPGTGKNYAKNQRRKQRRMMAVNKTAPAVNVTLNTTARTNRRNNRSITKSSSRPADIAENAEEISYLRQMQTLFYPTHGIFRGKSEGLNMTAIAWYKGSLEIRNFTTLANNVATIAMCPSLAAAPGFITYSYGVQENNPYVTSPGTTLLNGPWAPVYNADPHVTFRPISATMSLIPIGSAITQQGDGLIAYVSQLGELSAWSRTEMDQIRFSRPFGGTDKVIVHWVPNNLEMDLSSQNAQAPTGQLPYSAIVAILKYPTRSPQPLHGGWIGLLD